MHDLTSLQNTAWLMEQGRLQDMASKLTRFKDWPSAKRIEKRAQEVAANAMRKVAGKIAVLQIQGVIEQRMSALGYFFGGFATEYGEQAMSQLLASKEVSAIVLDIDSPGGTSYGVEEFSDMIYEARAKKPVYAIANSMCASAAYWIGSAAHQIAVTPSGDVGSIGVYAVHMDYSAALKDQGMKVTIVKAGKYKAELNPYEPIDKDAEGYLQEMVNATFTKFVNGVARNRGKTRSEVRGPAFGQGRVMSADEAMKNGLCDKMMTFTQLCERLGANMTMPVQDRLTSTEVLQRRAMLAETRKRCGADLSHDDVCQQNEPAWGDVDQDKLPRVAFADPGDAGDPESWKFAHHHITDGKVDEATGRYTSGTMWLNRGGLNAAWSALLEFREGDGQEYADRPDVVEHLRAHRRALGMESALTEPDEKDNTGDQAHEADNDDDD